MCLRDELVVSMHKYGVSFELCWDNTGTQWRWYTKCWEVEGKGVGRCLGTCCTE